MLALFFHDLKLKGNSTYIAVSDLTGLALFNTAEILWLSLWTQLKHDLQLPARATFFLLKLKGNRHCYK